MLSGFWSKCDPRNGSFCEDVVSFEACVYHRLLLINQISFNVQHISREMKPWLCGGLTPACVTAIDSSLHSAWTWTKARHGCDEESRRASHSLSAHFAPHPRYGADSFWTCAFCIVLQSKRVRPPVRTIRSQLQSTVRAKRHQNMHGSKSDHFRMEPTCIYSEQEHGSAKSSMMI